MSLLIICILIICGILANIMSALFGIGGGVLMVPVLHTLFPDLPFQMVSATSLTIVIGTSLVNLSYFYKRKISLSYKSMFLWSIGMLIGVQIGFESSFYLSNTIIISVFIVTLLILAVRSFFFYKKTIDTDSYSVAKENYKGIILCGLGGGVAGMTGIGGGSVLAPLVGQLHSVKPNQIAVYTNYMMVIGGLGSLYSYLTRVPSAYLENSWQIGYVNFSIAGIVIASSFITSFVSMRLKGILTPELTHKCLGMILLAIALYMLVLQL
ncbi:sulfite exporter TauE/SafE family protein [Otariodibacter sp.]|uniref:sulfite exporter TauE/SafE family protein n=1 Tax=Otariodibacter sp. TaxID=3030919 RepID=UPI00261B2D4A|nr:sulfite exporter TauE/SafE family protein [Otariodibacter sp.]